MNIFQQFSQLLVLFLLLVLFWHFINRTGKYITTDFHSWNWGSFFQTLLTSFYLKCCEPEQPIQPIMIRRDETGPAGDVPWFTFEIILFPVGIWLIGIIIGSLENDFCSLFSNTERDDKITSNIHKVILLIKSSWSTCVQDKYMYMYLQ